MFLWFASKITLTNRIILLHGKETLLNLFIKQRLNKYFSCTSHIFPMIIDYFIFKINRKLYQKYIHIYNKHTYKCIFNIYNIGITGKYMLFATVSVFCYRFYVLMFNMLCFKNFLCHSIIFDVFHT